MKKLFKKTGIMTLALPMFLWGVTGTASAETGSHVEEKTINYWCEAIDDFEMPVTITATVPDSVAPGEQVMVGNASATVTLPEDPAVNTLRGLFTSSISGEVTTFNISSQNEPSTVNIAEDPIAIPQTNVPSSGDLTFTVPGTGGIDAGPFTAGSSGNLTITAGDIETTVIAHTFLGPFPINVSCSPLAGEDTTLTTIPIIESSDEEAVRLD